MKNTTGSDRSEPLAITGFEVLNDDDVWEFSTLFSQVMNPDLDPGSGGREAMKVVGKAAESVYHQIKAVLQGGSPVPEIAGCLLLLKWTDEILSEFVDVEDGAQVMPDWFSEAAPLDKFWKVMKKLGARDRNALVALIWYEPFLTQLEQSQRGLCWEVSTETDISRILGESLMALRAAAKPQNESVQRVWSALQGLPAEEVCHVGWVLAGKPGGTFEGGSHGTVLEIQQRIRQTLDEKLESYKGMRVDSAWRAGVVNALFDAFRVYAGTYGLMSASDVINTRYRQFFVFYLGIVRDAIGRVCDDGAEVLDVFCPLRAARDAEESRVIKVRFTDYSPGKYRTTTYTLPFHLAGTPEF